MYGFWVDVKNGISMEDDVLLAILQARLDVPYRTFLQLFMEQKFLHNS